MKSLPLYLLSLCLIWLPTALLAGPVTPSGLKNLLEQSHPPLVVDLRDAESFQSGHIPGAINVPLALIAQRNFPSQRALVLYDDGLGANQARVASERGVRSGAPVFWLRGGLAAWESQGWPTTAVSGLRPARTAGITYQNLIEAQGEGVALLDLRRGQKAGPAAEGSSGADGLTNLAELFPEALILGTGPAGPLGENQGPSSIDPVNHLLVLIDDGDGSAEEIARRLRASGNQRVVVLLGGEEILRHRGRPGRERSSTTFDPPPQP